MSAKRNKRRQQESQTHGLSRSVGDKGDRVATAWSGLAFVLVAIGGLYWLPRLKLLWWILLLCGIATIPQIFIWWKREREKR
jgi:hypothetical protein